MTRTTVETLRKLARKNPPKTDGMSKADLEAAIASISETLRGYGVSPGERIALNEDRHVYREALSKATA
jgi:hypothetical protein